MKINELLNEGTIKLKINNIESPKLKARLLLQYCLQMSREQLIVYDNKQVDKQYENEYNKYLNKIIEGIPLQQITHSQEFMKMNFYINENVLIPRPDTEVLVEEVIKIAKNIKNPVILDMCTGSGAIAVSLAKYIENAKIIAVDISKKALEVAKKNAKLNNVEEKIEFIESNLFEKIKNIKFDIIVSNPPYIRKEVIKTLSPEVKSEPIIALDGGEDGLDFYKKITQEAIEFLKTGSSLCYEIGYDQKIDVIEIIENAKLYEPAKCIKDLYGNDRVIITKIV